MLGAFLGVGPKLLDQLAVAHGIRVTSAGAGDRPGFGASVGHAQQSLRRGADDLALGLAIPGGERGGVAATQGIVDRRGRHPGHQSKTPGMRQVGLEDVAGEQVVAHLCHPLAVRRPRRGPEFGQFHRAGLIAGGVPCLSPGRDQGPGECLAPGAAIVHDHILAGRVIPHQGGRVIVGDRPRKAALGAEGEGRQVEGRFDLGGHLVGEEEAPATEEGKFHRQFLRCQPVTGIERCRQRLATRDGLLEMLEKAGLVARRRCRGEDMFVDRGKQDRPAAQRATGGHAFEQVAGTIPRMRQHHRKRWRYPLRVIVKAMNDGQAHGWFRQTVNEGCAG